MLFSFCVSIGITKVASADDWATVTNITELKTQLAAGGSIRLGADIALDGNLITDKEFTLDLNGKTLSASNKSINIKADATISDSAGSGKITGNKNYMINVGNGSNATLTMKAGHIQNAAYAAIRIYEDGAFVLDDGTIEALGFTVYSYGNFTMNDGHVISNKLIAVRLNVEDAKMTMNGGTIEEKGDSSGILASRGEILINNGKILAEANGATGISLFANTKLTINYVEISAYDSTITGNGTTDPREQNYGANVAIVINDGIFTSKKSIAYLPQPLSTTTINGGTFTSEEAGIEIRASDVYINGGSFTVTNPNYEVKTNHSGTTTKGAAISVAQHTTKQELNLVISGGSFTAAMPLSETNPEQNDAKSIAKVKVRIISANDGTVPTFTSTSGQIAVAEDLSGFISAGIYSHEIDSKYVDPDYIQEPNINRFIVKKKTVEPEESVEPENPSTGDILAKSLSFMTISSFVLALCIARKNKNSSAA